MSRKGVKIGVHEGGGPPPGYKWNVELLEQAFPESREFLDDDQYKHMSNQVRELARHDDPSHSATLDLRQIEDFHELRDKGGILKKLNVRVFYFVHKPSRTIVILGSIKKENNGPTPIGDKLTMRRRQRLCIETFHPHP
jgi:mRNA-degrading endonuclease RelE of RelBE toxin-antitoxin system